MSSSGDKPSIIGPAGGVIVGIVVFVGVNITVGKAIIPTAESVVNPSYGLSEVAYPQPEQPEAAGGAYQTVCQTCHQADGNGLPGAFPPLAGSEWATGDPETPVRIALLGLSGEIEVKGIKFNSVMPKPAVTDEQIVEAVNHVRTSFGNNASKIDLDLVKKVKESLGGRTEPWTAAELTALRGSGGNEAAPAAAADGGAAPAEEAAPVEGAAPAEAAPAEAAPAAAPSEQPAAQPAPAPTPSEAPGAEPEPAQ